MEALDVATRQRQINILQCMVSKDEDEIIWTLSMNKDIMKKEIGFDYESRNRMCICGQMFEKLRHNNHVFHIEKLSGWVLQGRCPHVEQTTDDAPQHAATTFLHCACALGRLRVIKFLAYEHDFSLNESTRATLFAPIHFAIYNKDVDLFNFLVSKKVNINVCCRGEERYSSLMLAVLENAEEIVRKLLKMESLQKNFVNSYQKGALCCAVEMNNKKMVQLLTDHGVMATPGTLYRADIYGDDYITGRVLQTRDADFYTPQQQHTLIYSAVVKGKVNSLKLLLSHGFQLNHRPEYLCPVEEDPLFHATLQNNSDMVSVLLDHKADISRKIYGSSSYDLARILDLKDVSVVLENELRRKRLLAKSEQQSNASPFMTILTLAGVNKKEFISKLVLKGLDINATEGCGFNPLHESINREDEAMVKHLLRCGADPNRQSAEPGYMTPLHIAIIKGNLNLVKMLLSLNVKMEVVRPVLVLWGSDTYYTDWIVDPKIMPRHRSSLCDAVCRNFVNIAMFLLEAGNDIAEEDPESVKFMIKHTKSNVIRQQLLDHMQTPRSLGMLCRNYLRRMHRNDIQEFVENQELPISLKQSLLLQDCIDSSLFVTRDNITLTC